MGSSSLARNTWGYAMHYNTGGAGVAGVAGVAGGARLRACLLLDTFEPRIGGRTFRERERVRETGAGTKTPDLLYF